MLDANQAQAYYIAGYLLMLRPFLWIWGMLVTCAVFAQKRDTIAVTVLNERALPLPRASVLLLQEDSSVFASSLTDSAGRTGFCTVSGPAYLLQVSFIGYTTVFRRLAPHPVPLLIMLRPENDSLEAVTVTGHRAYMDLRAGRTVVNVDGLISNAGNTALEALEKVPGISIDKDGRIMLKGRSGATVTIDGKPSYLNGNDLAVYLSSLNASQISQVELIDIPPAGFDAGGSAGIINLKLKKNTQHGFNGSVTMSQGFGYYPKSLGAVSLNYHANRLNLFLNQSLNYTESMTRIQALRTLYEPDGRTTASLLDQRSFLKGQNTQGNTRLGADFELSSKTTVGLTLKYLPFDYTGSTESFAHWKNPQRQLDSTVSTPATNTVRWRHGSASLSFRHRFSATRELSADADWIRYDIRNAQTVSYKAPARNAADASQGDIPTSLRFLLAKMDYTSQLAAWKLKAGVKTTSIRTDNEAVYQLRYGTLWLPDYDKSNHFLYNERTQAAYGAVETKAHRWSIEGGVRLELTDYDARQLGNQQKNDSAFSNQYGGLFPSLSFSFEKDSNNTFSFSAGRRIDRPAFNKLNPFIFIVNKSMYQSGNPYFRPQFTWNMQASHSYRNVLLSTVSYSITRDYFSQLFLNGGNGIIIYTEGNIRQLQQFGLGLTLQLSPARWYFLSAQANVNRKKLEADMGTSLVANITEYNFNLNNQFRFSKGWSAEVSGFYNSKNRVDIQEVLDPADQLSLGLAKTLAKTNAVVRLSYRDVLYTNWRKGVSTFLNAQETFKVAQDTRVLTLGLSWRFGNAFKTTKRSDGAAGEEVQRVGTN